MATIRRRKRKYEVQVRRVGQRHLSKSFYSLKDARWWARQMEARADCRDLPTDPRPLQQVTLGELVSRYRDTVSVRKRGYEVERLVLNAFLRHPICKERLSEITTAHFARYRDERLQSIKPVTLRRQLGPIRNLFKIAHDHWDLPIRDNPLDKLQLNAPDRRRERRFRPGEEAKVVKAAVSCRNPLMIPVISFALETAMRRSEILAVRRDHIDLAGRALLIPETKNGHARTIPLTRKATAILRKLKGCTDGRLFPITANALRLNWQRLKRRAGISDLRFHDLRHEAISRFFEKGLTIPEVALISGHKDMRMLFRYSHPMREQIIRKLQTTQN